MSIDYPRTEVTALILAGGMGRRMNGRDKGLLEYRGKALVRQVADRLAGQAVAVLVSANRSHEAYRALGFSPIADLRADFPGPLAGIESGFVHCNSPYLLITPCDTPDIPRDLGPRLWQAMQHEDAQLAFACDDERDHFLHVLLPTTLAEDLRAYLDRGGRTVRHWLADKKAARAHFPAAAFENINEPDQLQ
jgi:molybdopterin-guanine dinucleotide biosynthesis protein A